MTDVLNVYNSFWYDLSAKSDYKDLLYILNYWIQVNCLKKFNLVITSQPEDVITRTLSSSISIHINILSGTNVKSEDSVSSDIHVFLMSQLNKIADKVKIKHKHIWIVKALDYLVPHTTGILIWATTAAEFLQANP